MSNRKKIKVAVTGNIGSGKSTFTKFLFEAGYPIILADDISKEILAGDPKVRKEVVNAFGAESFLGNKINKKYIADNFFSILKSSKKSIQSFIQESGKELITSQLNILKLMILFL